VLVGERGGVAVGVLLVVLVVVGSVVVVAVSRVMLVVATVVEEVDGGSISPLVKVLLVMT